MGQTILVARVIRCGEWWSADFSIDGKEYGTQAKKLSQVEEMVKDAAALITDKSPDSFTVRIERAFS